MTATDDARKRELLAVASCSPAVGPTEGPGVQILGGDVQNLRELGAQREGHLGPITTDVDR